MKHLFWAFAIPCLMACSNDQSAPSTKSQAESKGEEVATEVKTSSISASEDNGVVEQFLSNSNSIKSIKGDNPIEILKNLSEQKADKKIKFGKKNIKSVLEEARDFSGFFIIVEKHTIVKIDDLDNCNPSGSWKACMPFGEGFIKKGDLVIKEDYINNIIGLPDSQNRVAYLFK